MSRSNWVIAKRYSGWGGSAKWEIDLLENTEQIKNLTTPIHEKTMLRSNPRLTGQKMVVNEIMLQMKGKI